jgi:membrane protease YdiL (CAAX protease family)
MTSRALVNDTPRVALRARPRIAVIGVFYLNTFLASGLLLLAQSGSGLDPVLLELVQFGPVIGVVTVLLTFRRLRVVTGLTRPVGVRGLAAVLAATATIFGIALTVYAALGRDPGYTVPALFWLIVPAQFVGACGEELGWRSFLQPYLRTRFGRVATGVIVGLLWGAWHVQVFAEGLAYAGTFLTTTVAISVTMVVLVERARGQQLVVAGAFHALINLALLVVLPEESGDLTAGCALTAGCVITAALAVGLTRKEPACAI